MAAIYPDVANGSGTLLYWWYAGQAKKRTVFPIRARTIRHGGITTTSIDTTHLGSEAPIGREFGGRTSIPAKLRNPGQLTIEGFLNPQTLLPQGEFFMQLIFPRPKGWQTPARWYGLGHLQSIGDITIATDDIMMQTLIFQYGSKVAMVAAKKN